MRTWERHEFKMPDGAISYLKWERAGANAPWVHFAHANGFNAQTYTRMLEPIADRVNIIAWDARGHGQTTLPADPAQMRRRGWRIFVEDLHAFLNHIGKPMMLGGHSLGSVVSLLLASRDPMGVRALFLVDPVILPPGTTILWAFAKLVGKNGEFHLVKKAAKRRSVFESREAMAESYFGRGGFKTWTCGGCLESYIEGGTRLLPDGKVELTCAPQWESASFSQMSEFGWGALRRAKVPVTLVYGAQSDTFLAKTARAVRQLSPQVRLIPVADASHFVPMEEPLRVGRELLVAVERLPVLGCRPGFSLGAGTAS